MTSRRNIIIAISAIVVFAAIVGFFITLDVSPQIAYARLFIDAGLVIGLVAVVMAFYREKELPTESIVAALRQLKTGKYKTRISASDVPVLADIVTGINELAVSLEEHYEKQEEIKRNLREELLPSLKPKELTLEHSYHPELGPVHTIEALNNYTVKPIKTYETLPGPVATKIETNRDNRLSNTLIDSHPPAPDAPKISTNKDSERYDQDLGELYQRFIDAQRAINLDQIEYPLFLKTIEKTVAELRTTYQCQGIFFDIVKDSEQVALQPKIIR